MTEGLDGAAVTDGEALAVGDATLGSGLLGTGVLGVGVVDGEALEDGALVEAGGADGDDTPEADAVAAGAVGSLAGPAEFEVHATRESAAAQTQAFARLRVARRANMTALLSAATASGEVAQLIHARGG